MVTGAAHELGQHVRERTAPSGDALRLVPPGTPPGQLSVDSNVRDAWVDAQPVDEQLERRGDMDLVTSTRTVLWHDERLDVTDEIVQLLNAALPPVAPPEKEDEPK